jgi:hypothetical protein
MRRGVKGGEMHTTNEGGERISRRPVIFTRRFWSHTYWTRKRIYDLLDLLSTAGMSRVVRKGPET